MTSSARVYSGRYFRCRLCYGLRYASQSEKPDQRASDRVRKIAKRLHDKWGGATEDEYDFPPKPPRMRWATVVHKTPPPPDVLSLRDRLAALQLSGGSVPKHIATGILTLIERARPEGGLCHADLHPGNVIMTADGPRTRRLDRCGPRARRLRPCVRPHHPGRGRPEFIDDPQRPRAYNAAAQSEYARLAGMSPAALTAVMETYLPIACVINLLWGAGGALRERLIQRIEAALRSED